MYKISLEFVEQCKVLSSDKFHPDRRTVSYNESSKETFIAKGVRKLRWGLNTCILFLRLIKWEKIYHMLNIDKIFKWFFDTTYLKKSNPTDFILKIGYFSTKIYLFILRECPVYRKCLTYNCLLFDKKQWMNHKLIMTLS